MSDRRATRRLFSLFFALIATALLAPAGQPALAAASSDATLTPPRFFARRQFTADDE